MLNLKLTKAIYFNESTKEKENDLIDAVNDGEWHKVKLTTNRLDIQLDKKSDSRESYNFCCNSKDSILLPNNGFTAVW